MLFYLVSWANVKKLLSPGSTFDEAAYNTAFDKLAAKFGGLGDPLVRINRGNRTIEIEYYGEDLMILQRDLMLALKNELANKTSATGSTPQVFDAVFGTEEAKRRKDEILDDSRNKLRDLPIKEVPDGTPAPDPGKDDLDNLKDIINSNPSGVSFGGGHGDDTRNNLVHKLLDDPTQGGIELFFIEEIGVVDQPLVDAFINSPAGTPMDPRLKTRVKDINGLTEILEKVRDKNVTKAADKKLKVFGINSSEAKSRPGLLGLENRVAMMNAVAKEAIDGAMKANPGKKFLSFVGAAHSNTHIGGIPGISQMFGVPAIEMDKTSGRLAMDAEDKSLRHMPSAKEIKAVEKMSESLAKQPGFGTKSQDEKDAMLKDVMSKARFDTLKEELTEPYIKKREAIVDLEKQMAVAKQKGILTPEDERKGKERIKQLVTEMNQVQADGAKKLQDYVEKFPELLDGEDSEGRTLLHFAAAGNSPDAIKAILAKKPALAAKQDKSGDTPGHMLLRRRDFADEGLRATQLSSQAEGFKELLASGAPVDAQNAKGETTLHLAALTGNADAADRLLAKGANTALTDARGWTALDTTLASTKSDVEKVFYAQGKANKGLTLPSPNPSVVDILVAATLCEKAGQKDDIRAMYEKMYADELLRPILETAAVDAMQDRDPPNEGGVRIFVADGANTGRLFAAPSWNPGGQGGFDEKANTFLIAGKPDKDPKEGTLIHEMTHMVARKMFGEATIPCEDKADLDKYRDAIAKDVKLMHLMSEEIPAEARIKDRICGRMEIYANRGGDEQLLQEFIVSVPQLIAEYGGQVVAKYAPNLMAFFKQFAGKCRDKITKDPKYKPLADKIDNTALDKKLKDNPPVLPKAPDDWVAGSKIDPKSIAAKIRAEYMTRKGTPQLPDDVTIPWSDKVYQLDPAEQRALDAKMQAVERAVAKALAENPMAAEVNPDAIRALVYETTQLVETRSPTELEDAVAGQAANFSRDTKVRLTQRKVAKGEATAAELAEAVILQAEDQARAKLGSEDRAATVEVDAKKHQALIKELTKDLEKTLVKFSEVERGQKLPGLVAQVAKALVDDPKSGFSLKKKNVESNPDHVSIDKSRLRKAWLVKLASL